MYMISKDRELLLKACDEARNQLLEISTLINEYKFPEAIRAQSLSKLVRAGWYDPSKRYSDPNAKPQEFEIMLACGGPGIRIIGELDNSVYKRPMKGNIVLQVQIYGTDWIDVLDVYKLRGCELRWHNDYLYYFSCYFAYYSNCRDEQFPLAHEH